MHRYSWDLIPACLRLWGLAVEIHNNIQKEVMFMETHDVVLLDQVAGLA
jgi:hypothetical protein